MLWSTVQIGSRTVDVCRQHSHMGCGRACAAMMLYRRRGGTKHTLPATLPHYDRLNFTSAGGVPVIDLFNWVYNVCDQRARLWDRVRHSSLQLIRAIHSTSPRYPSIIVLEGHYVFCEGDSLSKSGAAVILDPSGGCYYTATITCDQTNDHLTNFSGSTGLNREVQGVISTFRGALQN